MLREGVKQVHVKNDFSLVEICDTLAKKKKQKKERKKKVKMSCVRNETNDICAGYVSSLQNAAS